MKPRITIRASLLCTAAIALSMTWFASQRSERMAELSAIDELRSKLDGPLAVYDHNLHFCDAGFMSGATIRTENIGPPLLGLLHWDVFRRVVSVEFENETDTHLLAILPRFTNLRYVSFFNPGDSWSPCRSPNQIAFARAARQFRLDNPDMEIWLTDDESFAYELSHNEVTDRIADPEYQPSESTVSDADDTGPPGLSDPFLSSRDPFD